MHKTQFKVNIMFLLLLIFNNKETNTHHTCSQQYIKVHGKCARFNNSSLHILSEMRNMYMIHNSIDLYTSTLDLNNIFILWEL